MKKKIDLTMILTGEYKETIDIMKGLSVICSPMTFAEREEVSRLERTEFVIDPNASASRTIAERNMFIGKSMAKFVIKGVHISSKNGEEGTGFKRPEDTEKWINSLTSSIAEMTINSVVNFVTFYVRETEAVWNSDPFDLKVFEQKQSSPQEESS